MAITYRNMYADSSRHAMDFTVDLSLLDVIVRAASATINGADASLGGDWTHTVITNPIYDQSVYGYLVRKISDSSIEVLVDTVVHDGVDKLYEMFREDGYELLSYIFRLVVPATTINLGGLDLEIWRHLPPPL